MKLKTVKKKMIKNKYIFKRFKNAIQYSQHMLTETVLCFQTFSNDSVKGKYGTPVSTNVIQLLT